MLGGMDQRPYIPDAVPKASTDPLPEISAFLEPFTPLFRRSQSRHSLERYVTGLLTDLDRKNCDTIAAAVAGTSTERLQHLLTDADWNSQELDGARVRSFDTRTKSQNLLNFSSAPCLPKRVHSGSSWSGPKDSPQNCLRRMEFSEVRTAPVQLLWPSQPSSVATIT